MYLSIAFSCKEECNDLCFSSEIILPLHGSGDGGGVGRGWGLWGSSWCSKRRFLISPVNQPAEINFVI